MAVRHRGPRGGQAFDSHRHERVTPVRGTVQGVLGDIGIPVGGDQGAVDGIEIADRSADAGHRVEVGAPVDAAPQTRLAAGRLPGDPEGTVRIGR